jgi:hypothetical protein
LPTIPHFCDPIIHPHPYLWRHRRPISSLAHSRELPPTAHDASDLLDAAQPLGVPCAARQLSRQADRQRDRERQRENLCPSRAAIYQRKQLRPASSSEHVPAPSGRSSAVGLTAVTPSHLSWGGGAIPWFMYTWRGACARDVSDVYLGLPPAATGGCCTCSDRLAGWLARPAAHLPAVHTGAIHAAVVGVVHVPRDLDVPLPCACEAPSARLVGRGMCPYCSPERAGGLGSQERAARSPHSGDAQAGQTAGTRRRAKGSHPSRHSTATPPGHPAAGA